MVQFRQNGGVVGPTRKDGTGGGLRTPHQAVISMSDRQRPTLHISNTASKPMLRRAVNDSVRKTSVKAFLTGGMKFDSISPYVDSYC